MTNRKVIYDTPEGELILFHNETQLKHFICNLGLAPEDLEDLGIHVEFDPVEEEYICEIEDVYVAPVFNPNPYMEMEEQHYAAINSQFTYKPEQLTLDEDIYTGDWPMVAYMCYSQGFSRLGDECIKIFNIQPLSKMMTVDQMIKIVSANHNQWKDNHERALEWEKG